jgi:hypothetical protein
MRTVCVALAMLSLAACHRGGETKEAVRQGVIDYLATKGFNMPGMSVDVTSVQFNGSHADAVVSIAPKGAPAGAGITMPYKLEQKDGKWVVTASTGGPHPGAGMPGSGGAGGGMPGGANPHGGMPMGGGNPHDGMAAPAGGNPNMPSPNDLPPVKK